LNVNAISFVSARDVLVSDEKFPTCFAAIINKMVYCLSKAIEVALKVA
jgi:hypothetical protein